MQTYHANATTNAHIRKAIQGSTLTNEKLSKKYSVSLSTVKKWKKRTYQNDNSSVPKSINYSLTPVQQALVVSVRRATWLPLDELALLLFPQKSYQFRSSIYRTLKRNNVNRVPKEQKEKAKKFKAYSPGYLHIDVTYLPRIEDKRKYLFVAIDRATRMVYYQVYENKSSKNSQDFLQKCLDFYPFKITHVLTDNGLEFTNRLLKSKKGDPCKKLSRFEELCKLQSIDHRKTRPFTPRTNGMVEKMNDIIKTHTIKRFTYKDDNHLDDHLTKFFKVYNTRRSHGGLRRELKLNTPFEALKKWYELEPEIFHRIPEVQYKLIYSINSVFGMQRCET